MKFTRHETNENLVYAVIPVTVFVTRAEFEAAKTSADYIRLCQRKREAAIEGLHHSLIDLEFAVVTLDKEFTSAPATASPQLASAALTEREHPPSGDLLTQPAEVDRESRASVVRTDVQPVEARHLECPGCGKPWTFAECVPCGWRIRRGTSKTSITESASRPPASLEANSKEPHAMAAEAGEGNV